MTPILGQGLNCGLEDVAVFAQTLEQHQGRLDTALPAYNKARWADVEAMVNINEIVANQNLQARPQVRNCPLCHLLRCTLNCCQTDAACLSNLCCVCNGHSHHGA